jgi:iron complex transport system ATP-binding protein
MVTHHLEEIPRGITHALVLRAGRVVAAGEIEETLTSVNVSAAFDLDVVVGVEDGRWSARVTTAPDRS